MLLTSPIVTESAGDRASGSAFLVLDARVDDLSLLLADLSSEDVLVLDPAIDGIAQITAALTARPTISSLHIVSHGAAGSLQLGSTQLHLGNLDRYAEQLQKWAPVLNGQDILLYGCQVAKGAMGHLFLQQLHQLTGANIAASSQKIGQVGIHQNWILETQIGDVVTPTVFSSELQQSYTAHFANVDFSATPDTLIESEGTPYTFNFKVDEAIPPGENVTVRIEGDRPQAANDELFLIDLKFGGLAGGLGTGIIDVSPGLDFSAFDIVITEPTAFITVPVANDFIPEGPESITWTVTPVSPDTTVSNGTATVNIFDDPSQVPPPPPPPPVIPEISLTSDITTLVEDEGTQVTFTISLSEPPPQGGLPFEITTGIPFGLGDFEFLSADLNGVIPIPGAPADNSGLRLAITQQTATIVLPIFDDQDRTENGAQTDPDGPLRNDDIGEEQTTFSIVPGDGYTINPDASSVTLTLRDTNAPANTPPEAVNDSYTTDFDVALTVDPASGVLGNDTDADGDALTAAIATDPANGTATLNADGSFTYTPNAGFSGDDTFTYTVSDGNEGTATATVSVTVGDPPPPPPPEPIVVGVSAAPTALVEEDNTVTTVTFTLSEAPPEGGLNVAVDSDIPASLAEFDVGQAVFTGGTLVGPNEDASGFTVNITGETATIDLPVFDDDIDEGIEEITYDLQPSDGYTIDEGASSVTLSIEDDDAVITPPTNTPPVADDDSYSTVVDTPLTVAAADGVLNGDTDADGDALVATFVGTPTSGSVDFSEDGSFTYTPNPGFVGTDSFTYQASDGKDNSEVATVSIEVKDDVPVGDGPVVSISTTPEIVSEADGTALVLNFSVDGEIPEDGIDISLTGSAPRILQEFTAAQIRFNQDLEQIFFFNKSVVESVVGGELDSKAFNIDPDSPGFLSDFDFTITDANASITFQVLDDIIEEADETFTYTIASGDDYVVDPVAGSSSFTVTDGVPGGVGPVVGVTGTPVELFESEQTRIELTFKVDGELPPDGVVVELASETPRAIAEFDVSASNPRDPEDKLTVDGPIVEGGNIVGSNEIASSLLFRITEPTATLSVEVFEDDDAEGLETFDYKLLNGEGYEVSPTDNAVTITIDDEPPVSDGPVVSISTTPEIVSEADGTALVLNFSVDGEIPEDGIDISLTGSAPRILQEFTAAQIRFNQDLEQIFFFNKSVVESVVGGELDSEAFNIDPDSPGFLSDFDFTITDANASITFQVLDDIIEEADETFTYTIAAGDDYVVDPVAGSSSFTVTDGVPGGVGPTVSFTAAPVELFESEQTRIELTFKVDGDLPPDGVVVELASETPRAIAEFDVTASNPRDPEDKLTVDGPIVEGGNIVGSNEIASSLLFRITEPTATLSVEVFEDDDAEGLETFDYKLLNGEGYEVSPTDNAVTITIDDEPGQAPETATVESGVTSVFLDFPLLEEVAGLTLVGADSEAEPFSDDFLVGFAITDETDFTYAIDPFAPVSGTIEHSGTITLGLGGAEATIGEFSIGFDPSRVTDTASGFFVADTLDDPLGLEILFDIGNPGAVASAADSLVISDADLLLSPELAAALGLADLAGADVGDARIDTPAEDTPPPPPPPPAPGETITVDFGTVDGVALAAGTVVTDQFEGLTIAATGGAGSAMIFDSANPTGGDDDLAVPEADNLLIISEDGDSGDPDDNAGGGVLSFEFDAPVTVDTIDLVDIEETGSSVQLFDADGALIETVDIPATGDGSLQELTVGVADVSRLEVILTGSGAIGEVQYTTGEPSGAIAFDIVGTAEDDILTAEADGSNIDGLAGDDTISGDVANDILVGNAGEDVLEGGDGNDIAFGGDDDDVLDGQAGNDVVSGDAGNDVVIGGPGNDILMGVTGDDVLTGDTLAGTESGSDLFVYGNGDGTDTITDFEVGIDMIGLVEGELVFADLSLTQNGSNTLLGVTSTSEVLAVLNNVQASDLGADSFMVVPDVSDPSEAIAFV